MCCVLELSELVSLIGRHKKNADNLSVYVQHSECSDTLRRIEEYLREDDFHFREVFMALCGMKIVQDELIPLLKNYPDNEELSYRAITIMAFLTMPIDCKTKDAARQAEYVVQSKKSIIAAQYLPYFACLFVDHLQALPHVNITKLEVLLTFVRNMLSVFQSEVKPSGDLTLVHEQILENCKESDIFDVIMVLCQHVQHLQLTSLSPLLLDIVHCITRGFQVEDIIQSSKPVTKLKKETNKMMSKLSEQHTHRRLSRRQLSGGYVVKQCDENGGHQLIPMCEYTSTSASLKNKRTHKKMTSSLACYVVKEFVERFLKEGYNSLMNEIHRHLTSLDRSVSIKYMEICSFCLKYTSLIHESFKGAEEQHTFDRISMTTGWDIYKRTLDLYIAQFMEKDYEIQSAALLMLKELLFLFFSAYNSKSEEEKQSANRLQRRILHDDRKQSGLLSVFSKGIKEFKFKKQNMEYGRNLVEILHVVMRMYEALDASEHGNLQVRVKKRQSKQLLPESDEMMESQEPVVERRYDMMKRVTQELAHPKVVSFYRRILEDYWKNKDFTNHVVISFLQRLCDKEKLNLEPMLYQLSFLRVFQKIMEDPVVTNNSRFAEIHSFCKSFCKRLFSRISPKENTVNASDIGCTKDQDSSNVDNEFKRKNMCGKLLFLELLISSNVVSALDIRDQYNLRDAEDFHLTTENGRQSDVVDQHLLDECDTSEDNNSENFDQEDLSCAEERLNMLQIADGGINEEDEVQPQKRLKQIDM